MSGGTPFGHRARSHAARDAADATVAAKVAEVISMAVARTPWPSAAELGAAYQRLQPMERRRKRGVYYTPPDVAEFMARFTMELSLRHVGAGPESVLQVNALDPACGCGVLLAGMARTLALAYVERLTGREPSPALTLAVLPRVILNCCFGADIDPVAVELTKVALSAETLGELPVSALDRHIVCEDTLAGPGREPPALRDKREGITLFSPATTAGQPPKRAGT